MEGQLFARLYTLIVPLGKHRSRQRGQVYPDYEIALILLWAAICERPRTWALKLENWGDHCPWLALPSDATVSRRARTVGVWLILAQLLDLLNSGVPDGLFKRIDARPLTVGGASKDKEAKCGFGAGKLAKGYKLHEIRSGTGHLNAWTFTAMCDREQTAAPKLLAALDGGGGYVVGDNGYDSDLLYQLAGAKGYQLVAPLRPGSGGPGHHPYSQQRLRGVALLTNPLGMVAGAAARFGDALIAGRRQIERDFAHETTKPCCHLGALPFWVRTPHRTGPWILCKFNIEFAGQWLKTHDLSAA